VFDLLSRLTSLYADLTASPDSPLVPEAPFAADEDTAIAWRVNLPPIGKKGNISDRVRVSL
jgi:hypothetical protein